MDKIQVLLFAGVSALSLAAAWQNQGTGSGYVIANAQASQEVHVQSSLDRYSGTVIETMNAGSYTYAKVDLGDEKIWVAGPATSIKPGEVVSIDKNMPMNNFHSKTLNRDFDVVYFVGRLGPESVAYEKMAHASGSDDVAVPDDIKKAKNGKNIKEIYQQKQRLEGELVRVRGMVTKYTADVMGKDWVHLRDSSSSSDLTVTTRDKARIGDLVVVEGRLFLQKNYGYGYVYDVILEDAKMKVE